MHDHLATFYLDENEDDIDAIGTRQVNIVRWGFHFAVFPSWLIPGVLAFDPCHRFAKQYGLNEPLAVIKHFPTYDEVEALFKGKTILPIMPEWKEYESAKKFTVKDIDRTALVAWNDNYYDGDDEDESNEVADSFARAAISDWLIEHGVERLNTEVTDKLFAEWTELHKTNKLLDQT